MRVIGQFAMRCTPPVSLAEILRRRYGDPRNADGPDRPESQGRGSLQTTGHPVVPWIETGSGNDASRRDRDQREAL